MSFRTAPIRMVVNLFDNLGNLMGTSTYLGVDPNSFGFYLHGPAGLVFCCLADAFEQMALPDSAAFYLERSIALPGYSFESVEKPFLHRRLAILYARMERLADAERHLAAAAEAWDRPDPEVRHMLDVARGEVLDARDRALPDRKRL